MKILKKITIVSILLIIMLTYIQTLVFAAESELTLTPKPETNIIYTLNGQDHLIVNIGCIKKSQGVTISKQLDLQTLVLKQ